MSWFKSDEMRRRLITMFYILQQPGSFPAPAEAGTSAAEWGISAMRFNKKNTAFTLTELMVVVIIIGVMASFAIPNYILSIERSHRRDAETQLMTIWSANQIYRAQNGVYWPPPNTTGDITAINSNLSLGIIPNGMTYNCAGLSADALNPFGRFTCTAARQPSSSFTITVTQTQISGTNPSCGGSCP